MDLIKSLIPELILVGAAIALMVGEAFLPRGKRLFLNAAVGASFVCLFFLVTAKTFPVSSYFKVVLLLTAIFTLWLTYDYSDAGYFQLGTYSALVLLATAGMFFLVSANDFLMMFVALELVSVSSFVLAGFSRGDPRSSEAAVKFFLIGAFSSALMVYGVSLLYGVLGTTDIAALLNLPENISTQGVLFAIIFILAGLGFKLSLVPFHTWVPDTYEGAPTPVTAFLSVAPKGAALGFLVRALANNISVNITPVLAILALLTMTWGNLGALRQTNIKRLLAYSSIAQMGYVMVAFVSGGEIGLSSLIFYITAYMFMNMGAFACAIAVYNHEGSDDILQWQGLNRRSFGLSITMLIFLLSLTGIPPLAGFTGKFFIFSAALRNGWAWLAIAGAVNSVISLYYYFKVAHNMFFVESQTNDSIEPGFGAGLCAGLSAAAIVIAGLVPEPLIKFIGKVVQGQ